MGKQFSALSASHINFIKQQKIYFVATAGESGNVNVSPKGGDSLKVLSPNKIAWLNLTGSGNESAAHILQNSRMTIMFCAFDGAPLILRAYGNASMLHPKDSDWNEYISLFPPSVAARQVFILHIDLVQSSCGMSVPYFSYESDRDDLARWSDNQGAEGIQKYWLKKNQQSIDGFDTEIAMRAGLDITKDS